MAAVILTETDTGSGCALAAYCSADAVSGADAWEASNGGTAGVNSDANSLAGSVTNEIHIEWTSKTTDFNSTSWEAGNWVVRLNVTVANTNITWTKAYVCRLNSGCTNQATVGSLTGQSISLGTTGVKSMTISGAAQTALTTDRVVVILAFSNAAMNSQSFTYKSNQNIDTPVGGGAVTIINQLMLVGVGT